jgi:hypothetical protein
MVVREVNDLRDFNKLPKSLKKTLRYIKQDVHSVDKLEEIHKIVTIYIEERKQELQGQNEILIQE